jgi:16S rRNA (adenine1518-N6/adenine1519-N6)-dimethyltransferase
LEDDNRAYLGQHFLIDFNAITKIIESCNVGKKDVVLEFGTGYGYLTKKIAELAGRVYTYEIDKELYSKAKSYLMNNTNVMIFNQDFFEQFQIEFDFFLSNIPYARSKEIMKWLSLREFGEAVIMVQKEFYEKLTASPGSADYSVVSVFSQYCFDIDPLFDVDKNSFLPPPRIESKVIRLKRRRNKMKKEIIAELNFLFRHRNKSAASLLNTKLYQNKKIDQLNVETLIKICNDLIESKQFRKYLI